MGRALADTVAAWQAEFPGVAVEPVASGRYEIAIPPALDGGHETHFPRVLDECLGFVESCEWPAAVARRTLEKYTLLAEAAAKTGGDHAIPPSREEYHYYDIFAQQRKDPDDTLMACSSAPWARDSQSP